MSPSVWLVIVLLILANAFYVAAEFGATSLDVIDRRARVAQARMRKHQARTRLAYDPVMVFPQGVFSSQCPAVLKRHEFVAAVNTEISPTDAADTSVADVWDVAIQRYGTFPIFTRRYMSHGLENFAFDLLLGKPCFIVAHHDSFADDGAAVVSLVDRLSSLNCSLRWRSPREVITRAFRRRTVDGVRRIEMYATELTAAAPDDSATVQIEKREEDPALLLGVESDGQQTAWSTQRDRVVFTPHLRSDGGETLIKLRYRRPAIASEPGTSMSYQMSVATRRLLSEFRDEVVQRARGWRAAS